MNNSISLPPIARCSIADKRCILSIRLKGSLRSVLLVNQHGDEIGLVYSTTIAERIQECVNQFDELKAQIADLQRKVYILTNHASYPAALCRDEQQPEVKS